MWHLTRMHFARGDYARASRLGRAIFERAPSSIAGERPGDVLVPLVEGIQASSATRSWTAPGRARGPPPRPLVENADRQASRTRRELIAAAAALLGGGGLIAACLALARVPNLVEAPRTFLVLWVLAFAAYALGAVALQRVPGRRAFGILLVVAGACRLVMLPAPPTLSTDAYRYVWDARVARAGFSPWEYPATAPELAGLRDRAIYPQLNHPGWRSLYPPGAQAFFSAVHALAPDSVLAMKAALALAELATLAALVWLLAALGLPLARAAIYAWNPLVLVEVWGSAHLDALAILCVVLAVRAALAERHALAGALLGAGALVKLYPAALLPLILARLIGRARVARRCWLSSGWCFSATRPRSSAAWTRSARCRATSPGSSSTRGSCARSWGCRS